MPLHKAEIRQRAEHQIHDAVALAEDARLLVTVRRERQAADRGEGEPQTMQLWLWL